MEEQEKDLDPQLLASLGTPEAVEVPAHDHQCTCGGKHVSGPTESNVNPNDSVSAAEIEEALRDVIDPELGINIVDLGLLYGVHLSGKAVVLDMTLTSAGCPLTDMIEEQCRMVLTDLVDEVSINWVWMPPWGPDKITPEGREQLRALGFNV